MKTRSILGWTALGVIAMACEPPGQNRPYTALGPNAEQLRTAFNADSGMVRVVMLASPT